MTLLPLQQGDSGVRAVASVTAAASTGTVGNFGVTLFKPLMSIPVVGPVIQDHDALVGLASQFERIIDDACLFWCHISTAAGTGVFQMTAEFIED
jgi:hypothetical protein